MKYYSLNNKEIQITFKEAVIQGLASDGGLFYPDRIPKLPSSFFENIESYSNNEIALELIQPFIGNEIPKNDLIHIIEDTLSFDFPMVEIEKNIFSLELFHGPTMAFKDVGARFMARCLSHFNKENKSEITVLVATSGDTGGAVASGFLGVKGIRVIILYPSGKVSEVQEKQLTTLGQNIKSLEVLGTFDDCQEMVKKAFVDKAITNQIQLTSANSINIARWLPQMFYFAFAYKQLKSKSKEIVFSIPSGNFGNICAGLMANQLGLPIHHFIASTNINKIIPDYMISGKYNPKKSIQTISNAMDVGNPSNFIRILNMFDNNFEKLKEKLSSYSFTDNETKKAIKDLFKKTKYIADPHGAVGYLGLKKYIDNHQNNIGVFLETAHPVKFLEVIENELNEKIIYPEQIMKVMGKTKKALIIKDYKELKEFLMNT